MEKIKDTYISKVFPTYTKQILLAISVFSILMVMQMMQGDQIETIDVIKRPNFHEDHLKYKLYYQIEDERVQEIDLSVRSKEASVEESKSYLEEVDQEFVAEFNQQYNHQLQSSSSKGDMVETAISLEESYKGCEIKYFTDESAGIDSSGWIDPKYMNQVIELPYRIKYNKTEKEGELTLYIQGDRVSENYLREYKKYQVAETIKMLELDTSIDTIKLPKDEKITFYKTYLPLEKGKYPAYIILLILSFSFLSHYEVRHQKELFEKEKRIQLMYFLNNFILMFHSGLTIQKSFHLSIENRVQSLEKDKKIRPYFVKWQMMIQQEREFYEIIDDFQKCFSLIEGRRFCRLILQNLRQGDHHLTIQLATLSEGMWDQRIRNARKDSEKASSKLVFPMLIIFIVILLITIVPSFMEVNMM